MSADFSRYSPLAELFPDEIVTHSRVEDVELPQGGGLLALITLDNETNKRPTTLGPHSLIEFGEAVAAQRGRAERGDIAGLAVTGKPGFLVAGADLGAVKRLSRQEQGVLMADLGHEAYQQLADFPAPTFVFINGTALGGGLEVALAADYRTVSTSAKAIALPEIFLGLVPGWGGIYRLPRLIGPQSAAEVIFRNALNNNRTLNGQQAYDIGIADVLCDGDEFQQSSVEFAAQVIVEDEDLKARIATHRSHDSSKEAWRHALATATSIVESKTGTTAPAPLRALEIFEQVPHRSRDQDRQAEVAALGELMVTDEFRNVVYAFLELVQKRAKRPAGVPQTPPRHISKVGIVGAGLMASQLALLFAQQLQVPVVITDIDQARVDKGLTYIESQAMKQAERGRLSAEQATNLKSLVTGSTDKSVYADADFIIEAVFEEISVKKQVLAELEQVARTDAVLATNTSSLSVTEMAADLKHPERVIGFHFFNPVAVMPLIEIAHTPETAQEAIATAFDLSSTLRKTPVLTKDSTAFVVNRVLLRLMAEVQRAFDEGAKAENADSALDELALPMTPFDLLAMVGLPVAQHVTESLHASFGERFYVSKNLQTLIDNGVTTIWSTDEDGRRYIEESTMLLMNFGDSEKTSEEIFTTVLDALAEEIGLLLKEGVVSSYKDVDLCMILGAGWPFHRGGITPYLDQVGASQRVNGQPFSQ